MGFNKLITNLIVFLLPKNQQRPIFQRCINEQYLLLQLGHKQLVFTLKSPGALFDLIFLFSPIEKVENLKILWSRVRSVFEKLKKEKE